MNIPIDMIGLCNNDDRGDCSGRIVAASYNDIDMANTGAGTRIRWYPGAVKISRRVFEFQSVHHWYGNMAWTGVRMERKEAHKLVEYLRSMPQWCCEGGPARLCHWFDRRALPTPGSL